MLIFLLKLFISLGQCFLFVCDWKRPKSNKHTKSTNLRIEVYFTERKKCDKNKCFLFPVVFLRENRHKYVFLFIVDLSKLWRQHWRRDSSIRVLYPRDICHAWSVTPLKETKTVLDSDVVDSGFQVVDPGSLLGELEFRVPCTVFRNSKAFRISDSTSKISRISKSGFSYMGREVTSVAEVDHSTGPFCSTALFTGVYNFLSAELSQ